jgi:hypothetical protein
MSEDVEAAPDVDLTWRKSSWSNPTGNCVELAGLPGGDVAVRNSRHRDGAVLVYTREEIRAFLHGAKHGEFDDLALGGPRRRPA